MARATWGIWVESNLFPGQATKRLKSREQQQQQIELFHKLSQTISQTEFAKLPLKDNALLENMITLDLVFAPKYFIQTQ
eukprot:4923302-Amphidinium_carterae.3